MGATPPPFQGAAKPKDNTNRTCLLILLMVCGLCLVLVCLGGFFFKGLWEQGTSLVACGAMFEAAYAATVAYSKEHNGRLPNSATWQNDVRPYYARLYDKLEGEQMPGFMLPPKANEEWVCRQGAVTGIAFNSDLSGKELAKVKDPEKVPLLFETDRAGQNLAMRYSPLPKAKAPKFMSDRRDWIVYYVKGNNNALQSDRSGSSFELDPDDALDPDKPSKPAVPKTGE